MILCVKNCFDFQNELQSKIENSSTDASLLQVQSVKGRRGSVALPLRGGQMARANSLVPQLGEDSELAEAALPGGKDVFLISSYVATS